MSWTKRPCRPHQRACIAHAVSARTLLLHGDRDFIPLECAAAIAAAVPGARLDVLDACGHFAFLERPDAVAAAVLGHLNAS